MLVLLLHPPPPQPPPRTLHCGSVIYGSFKREFNITKGLEDFSTQQLASLVRVLRLNQFNTSSSSSLASSSSSGGPVITQPQQQQNNSSFNNNNTMSPPPLTSTTTPPSNTLKRSHSEFVKEESVEVLDVDDDVEFVGASSSSTMTPPKKLNTKQNSPSLNHHSGGNNQLAQNCMSPPSTPPSSSTLPSQQQGGVFQTSLANNLPSAVTLAAQQHGIDPVSFMTTMHQAQQTSAPFASLLLTSPAGPMSLHNAEIARKQRKLEKEAAKKAKESPSNSTASTPTSSSNNNGNAVISTPSTSGSTPTKTEFTFVDHSTPPSTPTKTPRKSKKKEKEAKTESSQTAHNVSSSPLTATTPASSPLGSPFGSPIGSPFTPLSQSSPFPSQSSSIPSQPTNSEQTLADNTLMQLAESSGEKRKSRFVSQCSSKILDRIQRALKQSGKEKTDFCLVCGHNVHEECLNAWKKFDSNFKCPVCKTSKLGKEQQNVLATSEGYANLSQYQPNTNRYR
nr:unnamed protein product [Naegleria fowleri]